ncbi:Ornithine decarboxylase [Sticta canariensis]|nr:Ornithine decarboxylase [Sticta canariensis]
MAPSAIDIGRHYESSTTAQYERLIQKVAPLSANKLEYINNGAEAGRVLAKDTLKRRVESIDTDVCEAGQEDAFFVADMGEVYRQHLRWKMKLKRVKPHYAVKCNPDTEVLRLLAALDTGFDCASKTEIEQVLALGVDPSRIIYAQPCKTKSYMRYASQQGVKQMTFDNADELYKTKALFPDAELFLRILTDDSTSSCRLSLKFGASLDGTKELLALAKALDLKVVGVSFHIGSGASDPQSFAKAVQDSRFVFDQAEDMGFEMKTLDVGGGFSGDLFEDMAHVLSEALDDHFPPSVRIIGEPGRYYVASAFTLACNIIARRDIQDPITRLTSYMLYINDGVYGNFSNIIFDHQNPSPRILSRRCDEGEQSTRITEYSIWGPSCDGIDRISGHCTLRGILDVGDWLYFEEMGAYTKCSATRFNGFTNKHDVLYVSSEPGASALLNY